MDEEIASELRIAFEQCKAENADLKTKIKLMTDEMQLLTKAAVEGRLDARADVSKFSGEFAIVVQGANDMLDAFIGPFNVAAEYVDRISKGDIPPKITDDYKGDFREIKNNLNQCIDGLGGLVETNNVLQKMAVNDFTQKVKGNYQGIFAEVSAAANTVLDHNLYIQETVQEIAQGNLERLEVYRNVGRRSENDNYLPAFIEMMQNIQDLVEDTRMLTKAGTEGRLDTRANASAHPGVFGEIIHGINNTLDAVIGPLNIAAEYVDRISKGEIPPKITEDYKGDFNEIKNNLNQCIDAVNLLIEDALMLSEAGTEGRLDTRANASRHMGKYAAIVGGVNDTLDAFIGPFNVAAEYVDRISKGEIPPKITDDYKGDFNEIKNNFNQCIDGLGGLVETNNVLQKMAVNDFTQRIEGNYQGIFAEVSAAANTVLDHNLYVQETVQGIAQGNLERLEVYRNVGRRSENDNYLPAFIEMMQNIQELVEDTRMLTNAGTEGRLDIRSDASVHPGVYREIVQGFNFTLDSVVGPVMEAIRVSEEYATNNFTERFDERLTVTGDFIKFKQALNNIGIDVGKAINKVNGTVENVRNNVKDANKGVEEIGTAIEQVAVYSQQSAEDSRKQMDSIENIGKEISDLSASIEEIASTSEEVQAATEEVSRLGDDATILGKEANDRMKVVEGLSRQSVDEINTLNSKMLEISNIVKLITNISNQTNLLALNAAIEAARAGEHGRGFAVVAGEVRNLAGESKQATYNIEQLIQGIQGDCAKTTDSMASAYKEIQSGIESVNKTIQALNKMVDGAAIAANSVKEIAKATEEEAAATNRVMELMEATSRVTKENLRRIEDMASMIEEVSASTQEVGSGATEVAYMADDLKSLVDSFRVN